MLHSVYPIIPGSWSCMQVLWLWEAKVTGEKLDEMPRDEFFHSHGVDLHGWVVKQPRMRG